MSLSGWEDAFADSESDADLWELSSNEDSLEDKSVELDSKFYEDQFRDALIYTGAEVPAESIEEGSEEAMNDSIDGHDQGQEASVIGDMDGTEEDKGFEMDMRLMGLRFNEPLMHPLQRNNIDAEGTLFDDKFNCNNGDVLKIVMEMLNGIPNEVFKQDERCRKHDSNLFALLDQFTHVSPCDGLPVFSIHHNATYIQLSYMSSESFCQIMHFFSAIGSDVWLCRAFLNMENLPTMFTADGDTGHSLLNAFYSVAGTIKSRLPDLFNDVRLALHEVVDRFDDVVTRLDHEVSEDRRREDNSRNGNDDGIDENVGLYASQNYHHRPFSKPLQHSLVTLYTALLPWKAVLTASRVFIVSFLNMFSQLQHQCSLIIQYKRQQHRELKKDRSKRSGNKRNDEVDTYESMVNEMMLQTFHDYIQWIEHRIRMAQIELNYDVTDVIDEVMLRDHDYDLSNEEYHFNSQEDVLDLKNNFERYKQQPSPHACYMAMLQEGIFPSILRFLIGVYNQQDVELSVQEDYDPHMSVLMQYLKEIMGGDALVRRQSIDGKRDVDKEFIKYIKKPMLSLFQDDIAGAYVYPTMHTYSHIHKTDHREDTMHRVLQSLRSERDSEQKQAWNTLLYENSQVFATYCNRLVANDDKGLYIHTMFNKVSDSFDTQRWLQSYQDQPFDVHQYLLPSSNNDQTDKDVRITFQRIQELLNPSESISIRERQQYVYKLPPVTLHSLALLRRNLSAKLLMKSLLLLSFWREYRIHEYQRVLMSLYFMHKEELFSNMLSLIDGNFDISGEQKSSSLFQVGSRYTNAVGATLLRIISALNHQVRELLPSPSSGVYQYSTVSGIQNHMFLAVSSDDSSIDANFLDAIQSPTNDDSANSNTQNSYTNHEYNKGGNYLRCRTLLAMCSYISVDMTCKAPLSDLFTSNIKACLSIIFEQILHLTMSKWVAEKIQRECKKFMMSAHYMQVNRYSRHQYSTSMPLRSVHNKSDAQVSTNASISQCHLIKESYIILASALNVLTSFRSAYQNKAAQALPGASYLCQYSDEHGIDYSKYGMRVHTVDSDCESSYQQQGSQRRSEVNQESRNSAHQRNTGYRNRILSMDELRDCSEYMLSELCALLQLLQPKLVEVMTSTMDLCDALYQVLSSQVGNEINESTNSFNRSVLLAGKIKTCKVCMVNMVEHLQSLCQSNSSNFKYLRVLRDKLKSIVPFMTK